MSSLSLPSSPTREQDLRLQNPPPHQHRVSTSVSTNSAARRPPPPPPPRRPPPGLPPRGEVPRVDANSPSAAAAALPPQRTAIQQPEQAHRGVGRSEAVTWGQQQHLQQPDAEHHIEQQGRPMYEQRNNYAANEPLDGDEQDLDYDDASNEDEDSEALEFDQDQNELEDPGQVVPQVNSAPWVLQVVCPRFNRSSGGHPGHNHGHVLRRFHIDPDNMTPSILGDCIAQVSSPATVHTRRQNVVGLFRSDGVFVSLQEILAFPDESTRQTYAVMTPEETEDDDADGDLGGSSLSRQVLWSMLGIVIAVGSCYLTKELSELIWLFIIDSHYLFLELPLQQFYHLGPYWLGGWEGDQLPKICTRITYHGDVEFWTRNYHDCEVIYQKKLHAFMYVAKPACYLILSLAFFYVLRAIIIAALQRRRRPYQYDQPTREMMETYHAVNTLFRQFAVQQEHHRQQIYPGKN